MRYSLSHLSDQTLLRDLADLVARDRSVTADLLAHIAEADERKLFAPAGYPSMFEYCVEELRLSEDGAAKRIHAARAARKFPAIFDAVAVGRLHLSAVVLLAAHLTDANVHDLLAAATHRTKRQIELLLAERFPKSEDSTPVLATTYEAQHAPGHVNNTILPSPGIVEVASGRVAHPKITPVSAARFTLEVSIDSEVNDMLSEAKELLSHAVPTGDVAEVLRRALRLLIADQKKRKRSAGSNPRTPRPSTSPRHIPAHVRDQVWRRDGGQCAFVSESGKRCCSRRFLEIDHVLPVASGGDSSLGNLRVLCRTHNQLEAERRFGADFMRGKREAARQERAVGAACSPGSPRRAVATRAPVPADRDVVPWLRQLGFRKSEALGAAEHCAHIPDAPLEERVRMALSSLAPVGHRPVAT